MLVWKKSPVGYNSSYFQAPVFRQASFLQLASKEPVITKLRFRLEKTRYEKTWQLELLQGMAMNGDVVANGFRTAKEAMQAAETIVVGMGGQPYEGY